MNQVQASIAALQVRAQACSARITAMQERNKFDPQDGRMPTHRPDEFEEMAQDLFDISNQIFALSNELHAN